MYIHHNHYHVNTFTVAIRCFFESTMFSTDLYGPQICIFAIKGDFSYEQAERAEGNMAEQ